MHFVNIEFLALLTIPALLTLLIFKKGASIESYFSKEMLSRLYINGGGFSPRVRKILLLVALVALSITLARPVIDKGNVKVESKSFEMAVGFDISKSMLVKDIYPNRLEFAKLKFEKLLDNLKNAQVGVVAFSSRAFLVSPPTDDFASLKYLTKHMNNTYITIKGTNLMAPLESGNDLLKEQKPKILVLFTDGGDSTKLTKEIEFARKNNIKVFVYAVATPKGGVIENNHKIVKDRNGNIVISKLNSTIKRLALESDGGYMDYSLNSKDMEYFAKKIVQKAKKYSKKSSVIKDYIELFYYPLIVAILSYFLALFSLPRREK